MLLSMREIAAGTQIFKNHGVCFEESDPQKHDKHESPEHYSSDGSSQLEIVKHDFKKGQRAFLKDSKKLRAELVATKRMLNQALECRAHMPPRNKTG